MSAYCSASDVVMWWSQEGVDARLDDDRDDSVEAGETAYLTSLIAKASAVVGSKLSIRYSADEYGGNSPPTDTPDLVVLFTSVIAAYWLGIRRNLPQSEGLRQMHDWVMEQMGLIASGQQSLPGVAESFETTPFLTNYHLDARFRSARFRKIASTSVGKDPTGSIKSYPELSPPQGGAFFL